MLGFLERRGWIVLAVLSGVLVMFGSGDIRRGNEADAAIPFGLTGKTLDQLRAESPAAYEVADIGVRANGITIAVLGLALLAILGTAYRGGQRWSWWAMWLLPLWSLGAAALMFFADRAPGTPPPPPMLSGPIIFAIAAAILLGSARRFFRPATLDEKAAVS
jgi:drug/metabolite transporter (DMT)-like permease